MKRFGDYLARPLRSGEIDQAYPVVQTVWPGLDLETWRRHARSLIAPPDNEHRATAGIEAVLRDGYIFAVILYRCIPAPDGAGVRLVVETLAVNGLVDCDQLSRAVDSAIRAVADRLEIAWSATPAAAICDFDMAVRDSAGPAAWHPWIIAGSAPTFFL